MEKQTKANAPSADQEQRKIPLEKLRRSCVKLFGVTLSTFDGATAGLSGKFTVAEMQACIGRWLHTPVCLGNKKEE